MNQQNRIWNGNFILITVGNGLLFVNFHMLVPTIAMYAAAIGSSGGEIGIIAGIFALSAIVVRLFTDALVGRLGKKRCLFLGLLTSLVATAGYGLFPTFGGLLTARILHGFGFGLSTTFAAALAVEVIPPEHRGEGVGYFGLGNTISMGSAPAVGVAVFSAFPPQILFALASAACIVSMTLFLLARVPERPAGQVKKERISLLHHFFEEGTAVPGVISFLFGFVYASVNTYLPLMAEEAHIAYAGLFFVSGTLFVFLSRVVGGKVYDRHGPFSVMFPGVLLYSVAIFMICTAHSPIYLLCGSVFYGLGAGLLMPAIMTWLFNVVAPARRSNASATYYNTMDLGTCLGIVLLGTLAGHVGYVAIFYGVLAVMGLYIAFTFWAWKSGHMTDRRTPPSGSPVP